MKQLNYFEAVQVGRKRVDAAVQFLQGVAGNCHPLLFLKMGVQAWTPVGDENLYATVPGKNSTLALVICDKDGNAKAMSDWVTESEGSRLADVLASKGITRFDGDVNLPI